MRLFCTILYTPGFRPNLLLNVCVGRERWSSRSMGPLTEDSCLPILQIGSEVSWDSACSQVRTPEGRHHLVPVTERQGGTGAFLPPFSQGNADHVNPGSSWLAGGLAGKSRSYPSCHSGEGPGDLETGRTPPPRCAADCLWEDEWRHILYGLWLNEMCCVSGTHCDAFLTCLLLWEGWPSTQ